MAQAPRRIPNLDNRIVEGDTETPPPFVPPAPAPATPDGSWSQWLGDAYGDTMWGQLANRIENQAAMRRQGEDPGFDGLEHIPEGMEQFAYDFAYARNQSEIDSIARNIRQRLRIRERRTARSFVSTLSSDVVAGIFDPVNFVPIGRVWGVGFRQGAVAGATRLAPLGMAQEATNYALDPTMTGEEAIHRQLGVVVGSTALGSVFGARFGAGASPDPRVAVPDGPTVMDVTSQETNFRAPIAVPAAVADAVSVPSPRQPAEAESGAPRASVPPRTGIAARRSILNFIVDELENNAGIVDHPGAGGRTRYGIAQDRTGVNVDTLTREQAMAIYERDYWKPWMNGLTPQQAAVYVDAAILQGAQYAERLFRRHGENISGALLQRRADLARLAQRPKYREFRNGWQNRITALERRIGQPISGAEISPAGSVAAVEGGIITPHSLMIDGRGFDVEVGPTGFRDASGRPVMAAVVPERGAVPDMDPPGVRETLAPPLVRGAEDVAGTVEPRMQVARRAAVAAETRGAENVRAVAERLELSAQPRSFADDLASGKLGIPPAPGPVRDEFASAPPEPGMIFNGWDQRPDGTWYARWRIRNFMDGLPFGAKQPEVSARAMAIVAKVNEANGLHTLQARDIRDLAELLHAQQRTNPSALEAWLGMTAKGGKPASRKAIERALRAKVEEEVDLRMRAEDEGWDMRERAIDDPAQTERELVMGWIDRAEVEIAKLWGGVDELRAQVQAQVADLHPNEPGFRFLKDSAWAEYRNYRDNVAIRVANLREQQRLGRASLTRFGRRTYDAGSGGPLKDLGEGGDRGAVDALKAGIKEEDLGTEVRTDNDGPMLDAVDDPELKILQAADKKRRYLQETDPNELRRKAMGKEDLLDELRIKAWRHAVSSAGDRTLTAAEALERYGRPDMKKLAAKLTDEIEALKREADRVEDWQQQFEMDALPFGAATAEGAASTGGGRRRVVFDLEAVLASYPSRPWLNPAPGVKALAEDFPAANDWVRFSWLHEREHLTNRPLEGESRADYENRINERALEAYRAERNSSWMAVKAPIVGGALLFPTIQGQLLRLVRDPMNYVHKSFHLLASDGTYRIKRNEADAATVAGGSVFQKMLRHQARIKNYQVELHGEWKRYRQSLIGEKDTVLASLKRRRQGLSFVQFDEAVTAARSLGTHENPFVMAAAERLGKQYDAIRLEAEKVGMLLTREKLVKEIADLEGRIGRLRQIPGEERKIPKLEKKLRSLNRQLEDDFYRTPGGQPYLHRMWDGNALFENKEAAIEVFTRAFNRPDDGDVPGGGLDYDEAVKAAEEAWKSLTRRGDTMNDGEGRMAGRATGSYSREIPVTNEEALPFVTKSSFVTFGVYARTMGGRIEMQRMFGDQYGLDEIERVLEATADLGKEKQAAVVQLWFDARDRILGGFHGAGALNMSNRVVRALKNTTSLTIGGAMGLSSIPDIAKALWTMGPRPMGKVLFEALSGELAGFKPGSYAQQAGEALDLAMAQLQRRIIDEDDWLLTRQTGIERKLADLQVPLYILNGLHPLTIITKKWTALTSVHVTLDKARKVAAAVQSGQPLTKGQEQMANELRMLGIDKHDAQILATMPIEETRRGLILADTDRWIAEHQAVGERAADLLLGAISGDTRRSIMTPGPADRPRVMDGVFVSNKKMREAILTRERLKEAYQEKADALGELRRAGLEEGDPAFDEAARAARDARGELTAHTNAMGQSARIEAPFAALPFQFMSFIYASGAKMSNAVLSGRDRGILSLLIAMQIGGMVSVWLKEKARSGPFGMPGRWDFMTRSEWMTDWVVEGFKASPLVGWMTHPIAAATGLAEMTGLSESSDLSDMLGITDDDYDPEGWSPELGRFAASGGLAGRIIDLAFGNDPRPEEGVLVGEPMEQRARAAAARQLLPMGNVMWWSWLLRQGEKEMFGESDDPADRPTSDARASAAVMAGYEQEAARENGDPPARPEGPFDRVLGLSNPDGPQIVRPAGARPRVTAADMVRRDIESRAIGEDEIRRIILANRAAKKRSRRPAGQLPAMLRD